MIIPASPQTRCYNQVALLYITARHTSRSNGKKVDCRVWSEKGKREEVMLISRSQKRRECEGKGQGKGVNW